MDLKKIWDFIWKDDSFLSFMINIILAFLIVKFIIYPGIGFVTGTQYPVVAVVSPSMDQDGRYEDWWTNNKDWYINYNISKEQFDKFPLKNGFNKGDIIAIRGSEDIGVGDIIVFQGGLAYPIIHRVVKINEDGTYQTKGDANPGSRGDEMNIKKNSIYGKAYMKLPWFGWVKILAVCGYRSMLKESSFLSCMATDKSI